MMMKATGISLQQETNSGNLLRVSLSHHFESKNPVLPGDAYGKSFVAQDVTRQQLLNHWLGGKAVCVAALTIQHRHEDNFESSQFIGLDIDNTTPDNLTTLETLLDDPFIQQYAGVIYHTPSSTPEQPKFRIVFFLDTPVCKVGHYKTLVKNLQQHLAHLQPDHATKSAVQIFFGTDKGAAYINLDATLPLTAVGGLTVYEALHDEQQHLAALTAPPRIAVDPASTRAEKYAAVAYEGLLNELAGAGAGERNHTLFKVAVGLFSKAAGGWPGFDMNRIERDLEAIYSQWPNVGKSRKTAENGRKRAQAEPLTLPDTPFTPTQKPLVDRVSGVELSTFTAHETYSARYASEIPAALVAGATGIVLKSPIGTGKTEFGKRYIEQLEQQLRREIRVLVITHRRALVKNIAQRYQIPTYKDFQKSDEGLIAAAPQMAITYDSLHRLGDLPYDVVIIDEAEQFHRHLGGGTMTGGQAIKAYSKLRQVVSESGVTLMLDAHASDITVQWLESMKGRLNVVAVENTYHSPRGEITLHKHWSTLINAALEAAHNSAGYVAVPCASLEDAQTAQAVFSAEFGPEKVVMICSHNSESRDSQDFVADINQQLAAGGIKALIFTSSLGTGVDIQTPAAGVFGLFPNQPLAPAEMLQIMGRCRHAQQRHAYVQDAKGTAETDWQMLYEKSVYAAKATAYISRFDEAGIQPYALIHQSAEKLLSMLKAERNRQMNSPLAFFAEYARHEGYTLAFEESKHPSTSGRVKQAKADIKATWKNLVCSEDTPPISHEELQAIRQDDHREITPTIRAGHEKFIIQDTVGLTINPNIFDDHRTARKRRKTRRFADMLDDANNLAQIDQLEASEGVLLSKRDHRKMNRAFGEMMAKQLFDCTFAELPAVVVKMPADEIKRRFEESQFLELNKHHLINLMGWRPDHHSHEYIPLLRWMLSSWGIKLDRQQVMQDGQRFMVYTINMDTWNKMNFYGRSRLAHIAKKQAEKLSSGDYYKPATLIRYPERSKSDDTPHKRGYEPAEGLLLRV